MENVAVWDYFLLVLWIKLHVGIIIYWRPVISVSRSFINSSVFQLWILCLLYGLDVWDYSVFGLVFPRVIKKHLSKNREDILLRSLYRAWLVDRLDTPPCNPIVVGLSPVNATRNVSLTRILIYYLDDGSNSSIVKG